MSIFDKYNLKHEEVVQHIEKIITNHSTLYGNARIKCISVNVNDDEGWRNALCVVQIFPLDTEPVHATSLRYPWVHLLEEWIETKDLSSFLDQVTKQKLVVDGEEVRLKPNSGFRQRRFEPGGNDYSRLAGYCYESSMSGPDVISSNPLLAYPSELPFYSNIYRATQDWLSLKRFHDDSDARRGSVIVFAPECRARFKTLDVKDGKLTILTRSNSEELGKSLKVKGAWIVNGINKRFDEVPFDQEIDLDVPEEAEGVELYLLGPDGTIYDFHHETKYWVLGQSRVLGVDTTDRDLQAIINRALLSGECETVEFKPFILIGNQKWNEVIKTIIAFANTKGGIIIFGVNNYCSVEGVERRINESAKKESCHFDESMERHKGEIKKLAGDKLNRGLMLDINDSNYEGHRVITVRVPEGQEKPYALIRTNEIFVRRGSNNVRPDPDTELPQLLSGMHEGIIKPFG